MALDFLALGETVWAQVDLFALYGRALDADGVCNVDAT